tara:strand:- start:5212 stop:5862 length:651 start_codon:yes stop_codon:yes gene_type:complete
MKDLSKRFISSLILISIIYLSLLNSYFLFILLGVIGFYSFKEFTNIFVKIFKNHFYLFLTNLVILLYLICFLLSIWFFLIPFNNEKTISIIFILLICALTDIGGYLFGKTIGGKKFGKISPNKTYSGVLGSLTLPLTLYYIFYDNLNFYIDFKINIITLIIAVSIISQIGDLIISFFKRKANIKDTGTIIPGHGGLLDRIDGILLGLPLGIILISN